jgi:hypothetical protein
MEKLKIRLDNFIRFARDGLPLEGINLLEKRLIYKNPLYYRNEQYGRPNINVQPTLKCMWEDEENKDIVIVRGFLSEFIRILHANRIEFELTDLTRKFEPVGFDSSVGQESLGMEWPYQGEALEKMTKHRFGILVGPFGCGKKMLACKLAARRNVPVLVIVMTKREMYAWKEMASRFLGLGSQDLGLIGDGKRELGRKLSVAITLSLYKVLDQVEPQTGFVIVDPCDRANLKIYFKAALFNCPYMLGLAISPKRQGGLTRLMNAYLGPRVYQIYPEEEAHRVRPILKVVSTGWEYDYEDDFPEMITALCQDQGRNDLMVRDILQATAEPGARALVVSERVGHLEELKERIKESYGEAEIITGSSSDKGREEITGRFDEGKLQIILVTLKSIHTLEVKYADHLFVSSPLKYGNHISQIVGKLLSAGQKGEGEPRSVIHDYGDEPGILKASLKQRLKIYRSMGALEA